MLCMFLAALENVDAFPMWIWLIFIKWFWRRWFWRISTEFYIFVGCVKIVFYHIFLNLCMVLLRWKKLDMWFKMQRTFLFLLLRKDKVLQKLVDNNSYLTCTEVTLHQIDLNFNLFYCVFISSKQFTNIQNDSLKRLMRDNSFLLLTPAIFFSYKRRQ